MSERLNDFFVQESSEYLDQLARLLSRPGPVDPHPVLRLARGVRGSAQVAGVETIARVAERLEDAGRAVASGGVAWSEELRALAAATVQDLQVLVRALNRWGAEEEARVRTALDRWRERESPAGPEAEVVPIASLYHDDDGPHVLAEPPEAPIVPVGELLLSGEAALREAARLRPAVEAALGRPDDLRPLLEELFDLVELAAPPASGA